MEPEVALLGFPLGGSVFPLQQHPFPLLALLGPETFVGGDPGSAACTGEGYSVYGGARRLWIIAQYCSSLDVYHFFCSGRRLPALGGSWVVVAGPDEVGRSLGGAAAISCWYGSVVWCARSIRLEDSMAVDAVRVSLLLCCGCFWMWQWVLPAGFPLWPPLCGLLCSALSLLLSVYPSSLHGDWFIQWLRGSGFNACRLPAWCPKFVMSSIGTLSGAHPCWIRDACPQPPRCVVVTMVKSTLCGLPRP
eukprot:Gb_20534 [translate_table: standard]